MRFALVLLVACVDSVDAPPSETLAPRDAEATTREVFAVLERHDRAIRTRDQVALAATFAPIYRELACGRERELDPRAAAAARLGRNKPGTGWQVTVSNDHMMAFAVSTAVAVRLEVLERDAAGWHLVAGAVSAEELADAGCEQDTTPALPDRPFAELDDAPVSADAFLVWCGRWRGMGKEFDRYANMTDTLDVDANGTHDFVERGPSYARLSRDRQMAWRVQGERGGTRTLSVLVRARTGWQVAAAVWSPGAATNERCTTDLVKRGRVVVSDSSIEILDRVVFAWNAVEPDARSLPMLDAIAATLQGNSDITRIAIRVNAEPKETDPLALSEKRGLAVRGYLHKKGIAIDRLDVHFLGAAVLVGGAHVDIEIIERLR